ncbi:MAG: phosphodiester glycosidase family protein [Gemmatimonadetes bacterium]|nr:phosphodiester glycosidase family protein [Gemmatimonadota bacterium]
MRAPARWLVRCAVLVLVGLGIWQLSRLNAAPTGAGGVPTGATARRITFRGHTFDTYTVDLRRTPVRMFWKDGNGNRYGSFERLAGGLARDGRRLLFATNAGMFSPAYQPVGLYVERGRELRPLELGSGTGNFYLRPNGVFYVGAGRAGILPSEVFARVKPRNVEFATQSGPLLVIDGAVHRAFQPGSANRVVRSGVGVIDSHRVVFAISDEPVSFHDFALLFRDALGCANALYLDGFVSKMYLPELGRRDRDSDFGVIVAVTAPE